MFSARAVLSQALVVAALVVGFFKGACGSMREVLLQEDSQVFSPADFQSLQDRYFIRYLNLTGNQWIVFSLKNSGKNIIAEPNLMSSKFFYPHTIKLKRDNDRVLLTNILNIESLSAELKERDFYLKNFICLPKAEAEFLQLKDQAAQILGSEYKIHLQVKSEYFVHFVHDFASFLHETEYLNRVVKKIKITSSFGAQHISEALSVPVIVVYVDQLFGSKQEKNIILEKLLSLITERFSNSIDEIGLGITPRFSLRINKLVFLAGGDGTTKENFQELLKEGAYKYNVYTDNFCFVRGHRFESELFPQKASFESSGTVLYQEPD